MKKVFLVALLAVSILTAENFAQTAQISPTPTRQRVIIVGANPTPMPTPTATPIVAPTPSRVVVTNALPSPKPSVTPRPIPTQTPIIVGSSTQIPPPVVPTNGTYRSLSFGQLKSRIAEAKRQMQARPLPTALTDSFLMTNVIRIAFYDWKTQKIDYTVMTKESFLAVDAETSTTTSNGRSVTIRTVRGNGVNTPVMIFDEEGKVHLPLLVQYPIEKGGRHVETAYYISTHPGLVTPEVVNAGKMYVRNTIDIAREKLREKGIYIQPRIADIAERLSAVEHVDHQRFRNEYHPNIYNDIYALFALNEGDTYRFSVSSAGAGGMVQMIPSTYRMVRSQYYQVNLMPDFVEGMRNHVNAAQAMLLYMQWTWNDLMASSTVSGALESGIATDTQLMASGYNSNPARLAGYINRGGANWTTLIPRETKIYLQIYDSMNRFVPATARTK
ncbi:MAG: hypothetical protein M3Q99_07555 [Acidobacteriota bacterium]|nr:hypothetical protein [Acidobacteriota bacterium]